MEGIDITLDLITKLDNNLAIFVVNNKDEYGVKYIAKTKTYKVTKFPNGYELGKSSKLIKDVDSVRDELGQFTLTHIVLVNGVYNDDVTLVIWKK